MNMSFYHNIVCKNSVCDVGLSVKNISILSYKITYNKDQHGNNVRYITQFDCVWMSVGSSLNGRNKYSWNTGKSLLIICKRGKEPAPSVLSLLILYLLVSSSPILSSSRSYKTFFPRFPIFDVQFQCFVKYRKKSLIVK